MKRFSIFSILVLISLSLFGCSSSSSSSDSGGGTTGGSGNFAVVGQLPAGSFSLSSLPSLAKTTDSGRTITDVIAVNTTTGDVARTISQPSTDGSFQINLEDDAVWLICYVDRNQTGAEMVVACQSFDSGNADLQGIPLKPGVETDADLGNVTLPEADALLATCGLTPADLLTALDIEQEAADEFAEQDEILPRLSNPDIDGDAQIDALQDDRNFMLDFHIRFDMQINGTDVTFNDIIDAYLPVDDTTTATYSSTGTYVAYPQAFSTAETGTFTFTYRDPTSGDPRVISIEGGETLTSGTASGEMTSNAFGSYNGFGPNTTSTSELPIGILVFAFGGKTLTFSNVVTPSLADLQEPVGRIFPFIKFDTNDGAQTLASVSYKWMKKSADGWETATLGDLQLLMKTDSAYISIYPNGDDTKNIGMTIPITAVTGTIDWTSENATLTDMTAAEFDALETTELCGLGLSYDDKLGMRYFENIGNAPGTCGN